MSVMSRESRQRNSSRTLRAKPGREFAEAAHRKRSCETRPRRLQQSAALAEDNEWLPVVRAAKAHAERCDPGAWAAPATRAVGGTLQSAALTPGQTRPHRDPVDHVRGDENSVKPEGVILLTVVAGGDDNRDAMFFRQRIKLGRPPGGLPAIINYAVRPEADVSHPRCTRPL